MRGFPIKSQINDLIKLDQADLSSMLPINKQPWREDPRALYTFDHQHCVDLDNSTYIQMNRVKIFYVLTNFQHFLLIYMIYNSIFSKEM